MLDRNANSGKESEESIFDDELYPDDQAPSISCPSRFWPNADFNFVIPARKFLDMMLGDTPTYPSVLSMTERTRIRAINMLLATMFPSWMGELFVKIEPESLPPNIALLVNYLIEIGAMTELKAFPPYHDEPQFFLYQARYDLEGKTDGRVDVHIKRQMAGKGVDLDPKVAILKAIAEVIERSGFAAYRYVDLKFAKPSKLGGEILYPSRFRYFLPSQLSQSRFAEFRCGDDMRYGWVRGRNWLRNSATWIPAQLIYWNYRFRDEPHIWVPITNGAAAGLSFYGALASAILELIERDAFLIRWIQQIVPKRIDCDRLLQDPALEPDLRQLLESIRACGLELHLLDTRLDFDVPSVAAVILDNSAVLPSVSVGGACHFDWQVAIRKSLLECLLIRYLMRNLIKRDRKAGKNITGILPTAYETPMDTEARFRFWAQPEAIEYIRPFLKGESFLPDMGKSRLDIASDNIVRRLSEMMEANKCSLYVYEAPCLQEVGRLGFRAVRAISPEMMPLYMHEEFPYLGVARLVEIPKKLGYSLDKGLNPFPHPYP